MHHRPMFARLLAALLLALGLFGTIVVPSRAQDAPVTTPDDPDATVNAQSVASTGTLHLNYYLCDGGASFAFSVGEPDAGTPNPVDVSCAIPSDQEATFLIYLLGDESNPI